MNAKRFGDDRDRVSGGIVVPREGNPMLLCVKSFDSLLGVAYFKATPADLAAAGYVPASEPPRARTLSSWHEDMGPKLWWRFPITEPPYVGSPLDTDWPGYHTHWTDVQLPEEPR
jgi:hypothetical protein